MEKAGILHGDDFSREQIKEWYEDEQEAFTDLYTRTKEEKLRYPHRYYAFRNLPDEPIIHAPGFGSATGSEFLPIIKRFQQITILKTSITTANGKIIDGTPTQGMNPEVSRDVYAEINTLNIITCYSVLRLYS